MKAWPGGLPLGMWVDLQAMFLSVTGSLPFIFGFLILVKCVQFHENAEKLEVDENEKTVNREEELDDIDKKIDETKGQKLKYK